MTLKSDIVVVNEFSVPTAGGGSRGGTPGAYVTRYMARKDAVEPIAPMRRQRLDSFITRYMARAEATQRAGREVSLREPLRQELAEVAGDGGVAFGYGSFSLSDEELQAASKDIQRLFDSGHTVMKTVVSFDQDYLRRTGLVRPDHEVQRRGAYRGQLDQMKLHFAMMRGMEHLGREYDDLRYIGVVQTDTEHVHCHLAMVDAGEGRRAPDGTQKGKLSSSGMNRLRRGVDSYLLSVENIRHMSSSVSSEQQNVSTWIKRWAHDQIQQQSGPQLLLACLPEDRNRWRAGSRAADMRKPNRILRTLVTEQLEQPDSGFSEAMRQVGEYAAGRREREGLSRREHAKLVSDGRERIVQHSMNGVYGLLRSLPESSLSVRTPVLEVAGLELEELRVRGARKASRKKKDVPEADLERFATVLRTYSGRLAHHTAERLRHREMVSLWDADQARGRASEPSRVMREHWSTEEEYHARLVSKYRFFLGPVVRDGQWFERWQEVDELGQVVQTMEVMSKDRSLQRLGDPEVAEARGLEIYGQTGGMLLARDDAGRSEFGRRVEATRRRYERGVQDFRTDLAQGGIDLGAQRDETGRWKDPTFSVGTEHEFEQVKALDLHQMSMDFFTDVEVGRRSRDRFVEMARTRRATALAAAEYLTGTSQTFGPAQVDLREITQMNQVADQLQTARQPVLRSRLAELARESGMLSGRRSATVRLDENLVERVGEVVRERVLESSRGVSLGQESSSEQATPAG